MIGMLAVGAPAQAHNYLVSSTPAADSTLTELPAAFDITTSDDLLDIGEGTDAGGFALQVLDTAGLYYGDGCVDVTGSSMTAAPALGEPGTYTVRWQVVSADGHTVSDEYTFTWAPTAAVKASTGSTTAPVCGVAAPSAEPSPSASESASIAPSVTPDATASASSEPVVAASDDGSTVLWIGGAVVLVAAAVIVTLLLTGRKKNA